MGPKNIHTGCLIGSGQPFYLHNRYYKNPVKNVERHIPADDLPSKNQLFIVSSTSSIVFGMGVPNIL